jgi:hypothetical protein
MSQSINIVKLIEENPSTKLSKPYQGKLLNKLKESFSTEEQQLFISSFYCYLNFRSDDFVIDLDDIWVWLGYTKKDKGKDLLKKYFKVEHDFKIIFPDVRENSKAGRPSEKIMLNIKTFKKMCLKANTSKANEIHEYYIKLEETLHELIDEESNELRLQLEEKEHELEEKDLILEEQEAILELQDKENIRQSNRIKLLEIKTLKKTERKEHGKNVVYIITNEYISRDRIFMVGKAIELADRLSQYNKSCEHEVVYYRECNNAKQMGLIEETILYKLDRYRERASRDRFKLPDDQEISLFVDIVNGTCDWLDDVDDDVVVERLPEDKDREYYEDNKEYIKEYKKQHREENKEEISKKSKAWYEENKEVIKIYNQKYREENEEKIKAQKKIYKAEHKEEYKERDARYYQENKETIAMKSKIYNEANKDKILKQRKEYYKKNIEEIRSKDRARNPKVICTCGLSICKRSIPAHQRSQTHERFLKLKKEKEERGETEIGEVDESENVAVEVS